MSKYELNESLTEEHLVHVIDIKNETIIALNNFDLCEFINNKITIKDKRYLLVPNSDAAFYVVTEIKYQRSNNND